MLLNAGTIFTSRFSVRGKETQNTSVDVGVENEY